MTGGNTIRVQEGTYIERIDLKVSGSPSNPFTLIAEGGAIITDPESFGNLDTGALKAKAFTTSSSIAFKSTSH